MRLFVEIIFFDSYKTLDVQDGQTAQRLWTEAVFMEKYPNKKDLLSRTSLNTAN